jgi:imidazolonepropionase-like amidohydrolase
MRALAILALLAGCGSPGAAPRGPATVEATLVIHAARMLDVAAGAYVEDAAIAVAGDRIAFAGRRADLHVVPGARVVELPPDAVAMPGLIDAHVHLALGGADRDGAARTLRAGFTTVRDLGSTGGAGIALRDAIARGEVVGPRMIAAGAGIGGPGGACDGVFGGEGRVTTVEEAVTIVDAQAAAGVDVIKICTGGGVLPQAADRDVTELDPAIIRAIVEAARRHGLRVAAHAEGPTAIGNAVAAGVASIEHGGLIDPANVAAMRARGVVWVATLYRNDFVLAQAPAGPRKAALAEGRALAFEHAKSAIAAGVLVALGTDAIVIPHGDNARELGALVEAGLSPSAAIRAATIDAARLLDVPAGTLAAGALADVIAVRGDPLANVAALRDVVFVMKSGTQVRD